MVYLAFMSGPTFPEGASIAPVSFSLFSRHSFRTEGKEADNGAAIQAINAEGKHTPFEGCQIPTKPIGEVRRVGTTTVEGEKDED
jgi:hypothetical protein